MLFLKSILVVAAASGSPVEIAKGRILPGWFVRRKVVPAQRLHLPFGPVATRQARSRVQPAATPRTVQQTEICSLELGDLSGFSASKNERKTHIVCTMGPACWDEETIMKLIDAGMDIARINFSHGDHESHGSCVDRIRQAASRRPNRPIAILLDLKGPEIRTGFFADELGSTIELQQGQQLQLVTNYGFKGDASRIACSYSQLPQSVQPGNIILVADGSLSLHVDKCGPDFVMTTVMNDCKLGERKNMNLPGVRVELPVLQEKDKKDILEFGVPRGLDFVAASFVQTGDDVRSIRKLLGPDGKFLKIISKIENAEGLKNFDEIVAESDGIMIARGDLGMEIPPEKVVLAQKMMIQKCNLAGKPVITATQMMESTIKAPRPTRAEASDVANAVLDGTDCVMLSGETANGQFPVNAVGMMSSICEEVERVIDYGQLHQSTTLAVQGFAAGHLTEAESLCASATSMALDTKCKLIVVLSPLSQTAALLAKYRPQAHILAVTGSEQIRRQAQLLRGVTAICESPLENEEDAFQKAVEHAKVDGLVCSGDHVVLVSVPKEEAEKLPKEEVQKVCAKPGYLRTAVVP